MPSKIIVFGSGDCGQLGLGDDVLELEKPKVIHFFDDKNIIAISAGGLHNLALSSTGIIYAWGCNDEKALGHAAPEWSIGIVELSFPLNPSEKVLKIAAGDSISACITSEGRIYSWGTFRDSQGILGFSPTNRLLQECPIALETNMMKIIDIAAGANHLIAMAGNDSPQSIIAWGSGEMGQLGRRILARHKFNGLKPEIITPKRSKTNTFKKIACGSYHSFLISSSQLLYGWGLNNFGQLGLGLTQDSQLKPACINILENVVDVSAGEHHSIALSAAGDVFAWGRGDSGQLGQGVSLSHSEVPLKIQAFKCHIKMIAAGSNHNLAVDINNIVYSWGFGAMGQLGGGSDEDKLAPEPIKLPKSVALLPGLRIGQIQAGGQHSLILVHYDAEN